jgi:hypothetical protein
LRLSSVFWGSIAAKARTEKQRRRAGYMLVKYAATTAATAKTAIVKPIHALKACLLLHYETTALGKGRS